MKMYDGGDLLSLCLCDLRLQLAVAARSLQFVTTGMIRRIAGPVPRLGRDLFFLMKGRSLRAPDALDLCACAAMLQSYRSAIARSGASWFTRRALAGRCRK